MTSIGSARGPRTGGGTQVTITAQGFSSATVVSFGDRPATGFGIISDSLVTAVTPAREKWQWNPCTTHRTREHLLLAAKCLRIPR